MRAEDKSLTKKRQSRGPRPGPSARPSPAAPVATAATAQATDYFKKLSDPTVRVPLINQVEAARKSRVIVYITGSMPTPTLCSSWPPTTSSWGRWTVTRASAVGWVLLRAPISAAWWGENQAEVERAVSDAAESPRFRKKPILVDEFKVVCLAD
jgi:hypothetical protein